MVATKRDEELLRTFAELKEFAHKPENFWRDGDDDYNVARAPLHSRITGDIVMIYSVGLLQGEGKLSCHLSLSSPRGLSKVEAETIAELLFPGYEFTEIGCGVYHFEKLVDVPQRS